MNDVPPKGAMYLYDYALPPLPPGGYRLDVETKVTYGSTNRTLSGQRYFDVIGPRFAINPEDVGGVFPPRNGRGPFASLLPHISLRRRTLPWERALGAIQPASDGKGLAAAYPTPWLALLLLFDGENYEQRQNVPLENVLPSSVFQAIGSPENILVESLEMDADLLADIIPSHEEVQLLAHVRRVNADDRELSVEGSDGWFAVVVGNRLPMPGAKCRAVLVSLEGRTDIVKRDPPPVAPVNIFDNVLRGEVLPIATLREQNRLDAGPRFKSARQYEPRSNYVDYGVLQGVVKTRKRLVSLYSWTFTCEGEGDFMGLMQGLDVGMIGKVPAGGLPKVADSGHIPVRNGTRAGVPVTVLYRGPLVPFPLTRDTLGPYHSADQARRVAPDSGLEDISYAAAFEVGRLLAAADARLAQELMRWRRGAFRQAARLDVLDTLEAMFDLKLAPTLEDKLGRYVLPLVAERLIDVVLKHPPPLGDPYGIGLAGKALGLKPEAFARAFSLPSVEVARGYLTGIEAPLGIEVPPVVKVERAPVTLDLVMRDLKGLTQLASLRADVIENVRSRLDVIDAVGPAGGGTTVTGVKSSREEEQ